MSDTIVQAGKKLRAFAAQFPGAYEDHPWDEIVYKVNKKVFVFFGLAAENDKRLYVGVKLPQTGVYALQMPFVEKMGYNLGKSGWVSVKFFPGADAPVAMLQEWIDESYRAIAPKKLIAQLDQQNQSSPA